MERIETQIEKLKQTKYNLPAKEVLSGSFHLLLRIIFMGMFAILFSQILVSLTLQACTKYFQIGEIDTEFFSAISKFYTPGQLTPTDYNNPETTRILFNEYYKYFSNPLVNLRFLLFFITKILIFPLFAGVVYCAYKQDQTGSASFKDLIIGFEGKRFINLIGLSTLYTLISGISIFFMYLPMLFFAPAFFLAGAFIIIDNISLKNSIKYSFQIAKINFVQMLAISFISFLLGTFLGTVFFKLYLYLFTIPFSLVMVYVVYKNTVGAQKIKTTEKENVLTE